MVIFIHGKCICQLPEAILYMTVNVFISLNEAVRSVLKLFSVKL
ncbi:MAG: hypothetical protein WCG25_07535 [bacterium]